jgi:hypothetical protein
MVDITEMMVLNTQQFISDEFYLKVVGREGQETHIRTEDLMGDFIFPVHDGTLPLDRVALVEVWQGLLAQILADPELRQEYSAGRIFEYTAELGGAVDIQNYRNSAEGANQPQIPQISGFDILPDDQVLEQVDKGNLTSLAQAFAQGGGG